MFAIALLFGFTTWSPDLSAPADATLPTGPPAPHLDYAPGLTVRMGQTARWQDFAQRWPGVWPVRFDPRTALPRFIHAPGLPVREADALLADLSRLAGIDVGEWSSVKPVGSPTRTWLRWQRHWQGVPVEGDEIRMAVQQGRIGGVWLQLSPISGLPLPRAGELVRPLPVEGEPNRLAVHLVRRIEDDQVVSYVDRSGATIHAYSKRHYDEVQVSHLARTIGDAHIDSPARQLFVEDLSGGRSTTADDGTHGLTGDLDVFLDGPALEIRKDGAVQSPRSLSVDTSGVVRMVGGTDLSDASASVLHHFHVVFDWLGDRWPSHSWLGEKVWADVDISEASCNAFYTSGTINFFVGRSSSCYNFGKIADVIYHEVGHGIHHYILAGGTFAGDVSEGSADFVSATLTDDAVVGRNSFPDGGYVRELETDRIYPDDVLFQVHNDGLIWGSFLWNLRTQWQATDGPEAGAERTDRLFLGALEQGPTLTDLYDAVILADDDNGDLSDGTPHACELVTLLDQHGLGPGPLGVLVFDHAPLGPQNSQEPGYSISFHIYAPTRDCGEYDPDTVKLWFKTGPRGPVPGIDGETPEVWADWQSVPLTTDGEHFEGTIPRQLATTQVHYFMEAGTADGSAVLYTHGGVSDSVHTFRVGDRTSSWCEDFEAGDPPDWQHGPGHPGDTQPGFEDQWEVAATVGGSFVPDRAVSGSQVMGTNVGGLYRNNNQQYLSSPRLSLPEGRMTLFTFQRWLTVEDGIYDRAELRVDGERIYENRSTEGGSDHTLDVDWTLVEFDVDAWRDTHGADGEVVLTWTLRSDQGLEYGGWNLDDVCLVQLDDIPAHYRRMQLAAVLDADFRVQLDWENPWIEPLDSVWLVGQDGEELEDPNAADTLLIIDGATPGAAGSYLDARPLEPGESRTYAILAAASDDDDFFTALRNGDNRVTVTRMPTPEDTGDTAVPEPNEDLSEADSGTPSARDADNPQQPDDKTGCGCASAGLGSTGWGLVCVVLAAARRRRGSGTVQGDIMGRMVDLLVGTRP